MAIFLQLILSGLSVGMIYALIAFGFQFTFATSRSLNFGQGEALAFGALVGLSVITFLIQWGFSPFWAYLLMLPPTLVAGAFQGHLVEFLAVRRALAVKSEAGWVMATIALGMIFKNVAENSWGRDPLQFPSPFSELTMTLSLGDIGSIHVAPMEMIVILGALLLMGLVELFSRFTLYGKAVMATAHDPHAASLMGIPTRRVISFSYALSSLSAALAGVLIAPLTLASAMMGHTLILKAFAAAIIGGLSSGFGLLAGGIILGISETMTGYYFSTGYREVPGLLLLLLVLSLKPTGLLGKARIQKV